MLIVKTRWTLRSDIGDAADADSNNDTRACVNTSDAAGTSSHQRRSRPKGLGKLWTKAQFPEVVDKRRDMHNLMAAQAWSCPCVDRANCIGPDRLEVLELYKYRKKFLQCAGSDGGKRDAARVEMEGHYSSRSR
eukprot:3046243-Pleurochrysis_carterae.AAC.1